ncbi:gag protease polyprotein [Cucumis melo var. makuwa]|uniref:Gag protease polyprotein n=1 Tax=Cucumis melo var. makuwa TaxID=1194695 RepID=A0A5D3DRS3_CUCMM|nr:gag protease polyprotein [Cucumis melo var. makuwa]TYK26212.1 gag protease polyprotein [Cucumis melo var. makuwa]
MKIFDERLGLFPTQKKLQKQEYSIPNSRVGVGYKFSEPVRIAGKGKVKVANTCHITVKESKDSEEADDKNQGSTSGSTRLSAFQRLNTIIKKVQSTSPTPVIREFTFKRLSVLVTRGQKKPPISISSKPSLVTGDEEIHSAVLPRMKRKMFISVNTEGLLKVKRHDVVFTRSENNELEDEVDMAGCNHVTIEEASDHDTFEKVVEVALLSLEDGVNQ